MDSTSSFLTSIDNQSSLDDQNYFNFSTSGGVSSSKISFWCTNATKKRVGIIGGGAAGIMALRTFLGKEFDDVILLEAQNRLGGRIKTHREGNIHVEDGAEWIHGEENNVVFRIAEELGQLRTSVPTSAYEIAIVREDGSSVTEDESTDELVESMLSDAWVNGSLQDFYDTGYGHYFLQRFKAEVAPGLNTDALRGWLHYMEQKVNSDEGTDNWNNISALDADQWVDLGEDRKWVDGFDTLISYLSNTFPKSSYILGAVVDHIFWDLDDSGCVLLVTKDGKSFLVEKVLVTISVGCLKEIGNSLFSPPIPQPLKSALKNIQLGASNKIFIGWTSPWWNSTKSLFYLKLLWTKCHHLPQDKEWLYGIVEIISVEEEPNILESFVSGNFSKSMEQKNEEEVKNDVLYLLRLLFADKHIPQPSFFRRTCWNLNPWTRGSYGSFISTCGAQSGLTSRAAFRQPLQNAKRKNVVYWAGEHTHDERYGTVDGAMNSGQREALQIMQHFRYLDNNVLPARVSSDFS